MSEPPQHLLGGLNVALLADTTGDPGQLQAMKAALEEYGVIVAVLSLQPTAVVGASGSGSTVPACVDQSIGRSDPDAFDAVVALGGAVEGVRRLQRHDPSLEFVRGIDAEAKPVAAIGEGVLVLVASGAAAGRRLAVPPGLSAEVERGGAVAVLEPVCADGSWLSARDGANLDEFQTRLRQLLAERRLNAFATVADDTPSAVGEDG